MSPDPSTSSVSTGTNSEKEESKYKTFKFPSHQSHILTLAKMCKDNTDYTDCVIQCDSGVKLKAHRLVLGAASSFLKIVFGEMPPSLQEATVMVPGVQSSVVEALINFLYTGEMTVSREDTADLQLLIEALQIDPDLMTVNDANPDQLQESSDSPQSEDDDDDDKEEEEDKEEGTPKNTKDNLKRKPDDDPSHSDSTKRLKKPDS